MNDKPKIIVGLGLGLVALTFPLWYTLAAGPGDLSPQLELPKDTKCVEGRDFMKAHHMELLDQWRHDVVREGQHTYTSKAYGTPCEMSLTKTCLGCHTNQEAFCNRCHTQAGVNPTCWNCHFESTSKQDRSGK